jgi:carbon-monoxide dehydrogenase medium subunit
VKPAKFDYVRPANLAEAFERHAKSNDARWLAGGQSLMPMVNLRLSRPGLLIDVSRLNELNRFEEQDTFWRIGAAVTHAQLEDAGEKLRSLALMVEVASEIAYRSVRNCGTLGGSLAHADPAGDWPLALAALGASVGVRNASGQARKLAAEDFMVGAFTTRLEHDEIIEFVDVPKQKKSASYGYFKFCRKAGDFPEASAAVVMDPDRRGTRIFVGALNGPPKPLPELATQMDLHGPEAATEVNVTNAVTAAAPDLDSIEVCMHVGAVQRAIQRAYRK